MKSDAECVCLSILNETCQLLETYRGRDKIIRTLCYLSRLIGELQNDPELRKKLMIFGSQMSATRTTLRLFDDVIVLRNTILYGYGKNEPDKFLAVIVLISNCLDHLYLPLEKISWLAKHKLLTGLDTKKWDTASSTCWVMTSYLTILKFSTSIDTINHLNFDFRTIRFLFLLQWHKDCLHQAKDIPPEKLKNLRSFQFWTLGRASLDFIHAVSTLPAGYLWSSKLSPKMVNLIGTTSSIIGLYLILYRRYLK